MEPIHVGLISLIPPILAIVLALLTKEVIPSLTIGILSGTFIYAFNTGGGIMETFTVALDLMTKKFSSNISMILFLSFLGCIVSIIVLSGGSYAYGDWASKKLKSRKTTQLATSFLGLILFVDDYFNCLTIGSVMKPVTDKHKISRAKLAYIIDSTAAPICIIAPISSWAASIITQITDSGLQNGFHIFIESISYNTYAILTIIMVIFMSSTSFNFGPMKKFENMALAGNQKFEDGEIRREDIADMEVSKKGKVCDLLIPIILLIVLSILSMLFVGGYFNGSGKSIAEAFGATDAGPALALSGFVTLIITFVLFMVRKVLSFSKFMECINSGIKLMVPAFIILILAWTISGVCRDLLSTGVYVGDVVSKSNFPIKLLPAIIFVISGFLSFAMGTSWGTFGILIPIVISISQTADPTMIVICISAVLSGSVFGDHCSPISDTTILSSTGAGCNHIDHVSSQIPYTLTVAAASFISYIVAGYTKNALVTMSTGIVLLFIILFMLKKHDENKTSKNKN